MEFCCRHYEKPKHPQVSREVYLTTTETWESIECIYRKVTVCSRPEDVEKAPTNDVFLCKRRVGRTPERPPSSKPWTGSGAAPANRISEQDVDLLVGKLGSVGVRPPELPQLVSSCSAFAQTRRALSLARASPCELPSREIQKQVITKFVDEAIASIPGVLYICGIPGTGKTACVMDVLQTHASGKLKLVLINAMTLPTPQHVYSRLYQALTGQKKTIAPNKALTNLRAALTRPTRPTAQQPGQRQTLESNAVTLVLVDEVDALLTPKADHATLYNLFEWATMADSLLSLICISNTHDLETRMQSRISSRLANNKVAFCPYSLDELLVIAQSRLQGIIPNLFHDNAIQYCARKVASTSGDVRRLLELMRRSLDIAEEELLSAPGQPSSMDLSGVVTTKMCCRAVQEVYDSVHMQFLRSCSLLEKVLMVALMLEVRATKKAVSTVNALHHRVETHLALLIPDANCCEGTVVSLVAGLVQKGLLTCTTTDTSYNIFTKVQFKVDMEDAAEAFKQDARLSPVVYLMCSTSHR